MQQNQIMKKSFDEWNKAQLLTLEAALGSYEKYMKLLLVFLKGEGVTDLSAIDFSLRQKFKQYLENFQYKTKLKNALLSCFDNIVLELLKEKSYIEREITINSYFFRNDKIFLLYYPVYSVAKGYKRIHDKEKVLFWDFSLINPRLARQLKQTIIYLTNHFPLKERSQKLISLKYLMEFCKLKKITDIGQITDADKRQFDLLINEKPTKINGGIVDLSIYAVEMGEKRFDFSKNIWFLDALKISDIRRNEARPIKSINFMGIENAANRGYCKEYLKYLIGITDTALATVRSEYSYIKELAVYFSEKNIDLTEVKESEMEEYFSWLEEQKKTSDGGFNRKIFAIKNFYGYMAKKYEIDERIMKSFYYKIIYPKHIERIVEDKVIKKILSILPKENLLLSLMYKIQLETGIRINEVCMLKGDCLTASGWLKVYQPKMKTEKMVPISGRLENELQKYMEGTNATLNGYIFKNADGNAFNANTYSVSMVRFCIKHGISCENWVFRSHDYRHLLATKLHEAEIQINIIRDFLGHKSDEMTKQYIDAIDCEIAKQQEEYFEKRDKDD